MFEAPELLELRWVNISWVAARFAIVLWTAAIAMVAIRTARRIDDAVPDSVVAAVGDDMTIVVLVGVVLLAALFVASLVWSRTVAENTRRLRGRWPSMNRATRVWFYPTVWVALAALTFLRIKVTSDFNPLPAIAAIVFAIVLYCPYSMLHRVFKTLSACGPTERFERRTCSTSPGSGSFGGASRIGRIRSHPTTRASSMRWRGRLSHRPACS